MNETRLRARPSTGAQDILARWLSILLDSSVIAVPVFLGAAWAETGALLPALGWAALALLFADGVPLTYINLGRRLGWVSGFDLPRRQERAPFIAVNLIGNALGYFLLRALNAPASLSALLLVYVALGVTMLTISNFWKISLHAGGVGGFAAFLTWLFGSAWALTFLAIPLVGWARVYRRRHTWAQVAAGGIVGASVTLTVLAIALGNG
jgi:membrane-associated phospholipid phosphatase